MANIVRGAFILFFAFGILLSKGFAQERPYFVTYDHHMEEPENLEVATNPVIVRSSGIHSFIGNWTELEYGAVLSIPTEFPSKNNSTLLIVIGGDTVATAVSARDWPTTAFWPLVGLVRLTVRGLSRTVNVFVEELLSCGMGLELSVAPR